MASTPISAAAVEELANEVMGEVAESLEQFAPATAVMEVAANPEVPITSGFIPEPGTPRTTWSRGEGLDEKFYEPESFENLLDFIEDIEFKATIDTDDYISHSNINGRVYFYDENSNSRGQLHIHSWADSNQDYIGGNASDFDSIEVIDGKTQIEYRENIKDPWGARDFVRRLSDVTMSTEETTIFIAPTEIHARGLISGNGNTELHRNNPISDNYSDLSASAPITIKLTSDVVDEINQLREDSQIDFDSSKIFSFGSENIPSDSDKNITINVADYQDGPGNLDIFSLNQDLRLNLLLNSDVSETISDFDDAHAHINLRSSNNGTGNSNWIHLNSNDWDQEQEDYRDDRSPRDYVEKWADGQSKIELTLDPWTISNAYNFLDEGEFIDTYYFEHANVHFNTIAGGHSHGSINQDQASQLDFLNSITLDFTGYIPTSIEDQDINLSIEPLVDAIDIAKIAGDYDYDIVDFNFDGAHHAGYWAEYQLIDANGGHIGNINFGGHVNAEDDYDQEHFDGWVNSQITDLFNVSAYLRRLNINGEGAGTDSHGYLGLEFNYDQNNDSVSLSRIEGHGWGEQYRSEDGSGPLPDNIQFNWEKFADLDIINFESGFLDNDVDVDITTYLSDGSDPEPGDASILLSYNLYQQENYLIDEPNVGVDPINQLAVLGDAVDHSSRFVLDINAESLEDDYNIESTDITIKFDPQLFGTINASDIKIGGALPLANAVHIDNEAGTIRLAAASLSDLEKGGSGIWGEEALASIALDFDEDQIQYLDKNPDGSLKISPLTFDISVNEQETVFSTDFIDDSGLLNREIVTLDDLGGSAEVVGQEVTLYEA